MNDWPVGYTADRYLEACTRAATDEEAFSRFKVDPEYTPILEHLNYNDGNYYISLMPDGKPEDLDLFRDNDLYGSTVTYEYGDWGRFSPSTLRYIKNLEDVKHLTGGDFNTVVEIGGGYGGLALVTMKRYDCQYYIIDHPSVNQLSDRYIKMFPEMSDRFKTISYLDIEVPEKIDLVMSHYAISELDFNLQMKYMDLVVLKADYIYITYNFIISGANENFNKILQLISKTHDTVVTSEYPGNAIIKSVRRGL